MVQPGNAPQGSQSVVDSVREKLKRFYDELSDDERAYVEARMKQAVTSAATAAGTAPGLEGPALLAWNNSSKQLVVTSIDTSQCTVKDNMFDGRSPQVGDIIGPGDRYMFTWIEYFFGSCIDVTWQAQDGSGTIRTRMGMDFISGWGYGCDNATGSLACGDPGTNPPNWQNNVEIVDR
jgi:hypothetical protein